MRKSQWAASVLCFTLIIFTALPGKGASVPCGAFLAAVVFIEAAMLFTGQNRERAQSSGDICTAVFAFLLVWEVAARHLCCVNPVLIPPPENVFYVFVTHGRAMARGVAASLELLAAGFAVSLLFGVGLGLLIGWISRLREMLYPMIKVLAPIPSVIYTPYIIALMPSFRSASAMVIILGLFFPTLLQMIGRVMSMDRRIIDSARMMGVSNGTMILRVLLPYMIPGVISGLRVSLSTSFMILTLAEMMGATSGLGYFIKNYADFANYANVIAGIILVGIVVTALNGVVTVVEKRAVKWRIT